MRILCISGFYSHRYLHTDRMQYSATRLQLLLSSRCFWPPAWLELILRGLGLYTATWLQFFLGCLSLWPTTRLQLILGRLSLWTAARLQFFFRCRLFVATTRLEFLFRAVFVSSLIVFEHLVILLTSCITKEISIVEQVELRIGAIQVVLEFFFHFLHLD